ncbi:MAG TPA: hypothetical protein VGM28_01805 [Candidatus Limnocylindrales bacterium]
MRLSLHERGGIRTDHHAVPGAPIPCYRQWDFSKQSKRMCEPRLEAFQEGQVGSIAHRAPDRVQLERCGLPDGACGAAQLVEIRRIELSAFDPPELRGRHPGSLRGGREAQAGRQPRIAKLGPDPMCDPTGVRDAQVRAPLSGRHARSVKALTSLRLYGRPDCW